jgi:26S proteasome regulatory subunit N4
MSRDAVIKYSQEKEKIEKEIEDICKFLTGPGMPGLKGSLIDSEGFPLSGIDLYQIRQARQRYNVLNNDYTVLMNKIEAELHSYFGNSESVNAKVTQEVPVRVQVGLNDSPVAFAEITEVTQASPASIAGFVPRDRIVKFGNVNYTNHNQLNSLADFVRANEGNQIKVLVLRGPENSQVTLNVTPQKWDGPGILGCRFRPIN